MTPVVARVMGRRLFAWARIIIVFLAGPLQPGSNPNGPPSSAGGCIQPPEQIKSILNFMVGGAEPSSVRDA